MCEAHVVGNGPGCARVKVDGAHNELDDVGVVRTPEVKVCFDFAGQVEIELQVAPAPAQEVDVVNGVLAILEAQEGLGGCGRLFLFIKKGGLTGYGVCRMYEKVRVRCGLMDGVTIRCGAIPLDPFASLQIDYLECSLFEVDLVGRGERDGKQQEMDEVQHGHYRW